MLPHSSAHLTESGEIHLIDPESGSALEIAPRRGALLKRFRCAGRDILYFDEDSFRQPGRSVRGGIPLLFPSPGALQNDQFHCDGRRGALPRHGFARNRPFVVQSFSAADKSVSLIQEFHADEAFPWSGALQITMNLKMRGLELHCKVHNHSNSDMPFALGFHPYFLWPDAKKSELRVEHHAEQAFDNVRKEQMRVHKHIDLCVEELDLHLIDHPSSSMSLFHNDKLYLTMRASDPFHVWVLWTQRGRDFVCVEPWTALGDALNSGERLLRVAPNQSKDLSLSIDVAH